MLVNKALNPIFHPDSHFDQVSNRTPKIPIFRSKSKVSTPNRKIFPPISYPHPHFSLKNRAVLYVERGRIAPIHRSAAYKIATLSTAQTAAFLAITMPTKSGMTDHYRGTLNILLLMPSLRILALSVFGLIFNVAAAPKGPSMRPCAARSDFSICSFIASSSASTGD